MRKLILIVLLLLQGAVASASGNYLLISDIDDTIKITDVLSYRDAIWNGLYHKDTFLGMKELLVELSKASQEMVYLSGAPQSLIPRTHDGLVTDQGFPEGTFIFNNWSIWDWRRWKMVLNFKFWALEDLAKKSDLPFLLLGDNTQSDPDVFAKYLKTHGNDKVVHAYVHQVIEKKLPEVEFPKKLTPYFTAFDIALIELEEHRLSPEQAILVGDAILNAEKPEFLFPSYVYCPVGQHREVGVVAAANPKLVELNVKMTNYVNSICSKR